MRISDWVQTCALPISGYDQRSGTPMVSFRFDTAGAKRFAEVTQQNVGQPFAIVLDNKVLSAPVIREPILGGSGQITGNFSVAEANDLAELGRASCRERVCQCG